MPNTKRMEYKELSGHKPMLNFDALVENAIRGLCENYYKFFVSQSIKEPEKVASAKRMFEDLGVPIKAK